MVLKIVHRVVLIGQTSIAGPQPRIKTRGTSHPGVLHPHDINEATMGLFGYAFISLSKDQVHARRLVLDRYALVAQLSAIIVLLAISLCRLASWLRRRYGKGDEEQTPSSPYLKAGLENDKASWPKWLSRRVSWAQWWLGEDVPFGMGNRAEWFYGSLWLCWLLILCINDTGEGT